MLPLGIITGYKFHSAVSTYLQVDRLLRDTAQEWIPGTPLNIAKLAPALPLLPKLEAAQAGLVSGWKWTYGLYSVLTFLLVATLTTTAALHLSSLRRRINRTARESTTFICILRLITNNICYSVTVDELRGIDHSRAAGEQIRRTYQVSLSLRFQPLLFLLAQTLIFNLLQTLVATVVAFVVLGITFVTISSYAAAKPEALTDPSTCQVLVAGPLWAFAVLGFPTSVSLVWRAWEAKGRWAEVSHDSRSGSGAERSRQRREEIEAVKKYSIELGGRSRQNNGAVNVTVDVLVKEEGGIHELEKWESLSSSKI